mgnify:CR=1 FL=1
MRTISTQQITDTVARLCIEANTRLPRDVQEALDKARAEEPWPLAKNTLDLLWSNLSAAKEENLPICHRLQMCEHPGNRAFAGTRLTYNSKAFSPFQPKAYVIHCSHGLFS